MNFKEIKELIEILDQSNLTEINIQEKDNIVSLKKEKETEIITPQYTTQAAPVYQSSESNSASPVSQNDAATAEKPHSDENYNTINAPMVGTFYKSPSPEEEAYVQVGDKVTNDSTVCILEIIQWNSSWDYRWNRRNISRRRTNGRVWPTVI